MKAEDAGSVLVMPKPSYDSNTGMLFSLGWQDNNHHGTMRPIMLDLKYTSDRSGQKVWGERFSFEWPFVVGKTSLAWDLDQTLGYYSEDKVLSVACESGLAAILPLGEGKLRFGPTQAYRYNPYDEVEELYRGQYFESALGAALEYPLPIELGSIGPLYLGVGETIARYWNPGGFGEEERRAAEVSRGLEIRSRQSLSVGGADWIGNFRRGLALSVSAAEDYDLGAGAWADRFAASASAYGTAGSRLGVSGRILAVRNVNDSDRLAGEPLRGVLDTRIVADAAVYANLDLSLLLWRFAPGERSGSRKWRVFWFEQQLSPFFDAGLASGGESGRAFDFRDAWYAGGLETLVFPLAFKSYYIRISMGWDLRSLYDDIDDGKPIRKALFADSPRDGEKAYELFIGLGSHY